MSQSLRLARWITKTQHLQHQNNTPPTQLPWLWSTTRGLLVHHDPLEDILV